MLYDVIGISTSSVQPLPGGVMHSYVLPGAAWEVPAQRAASVDSIPFTHPAHVPALLELLRHQCAINTLLTSCMTSERARTGRTSQNGARQRLCMKSYDSHLMLFIGGLCYQVRFVTRTSKSFRSLTPAFL